MNLLRVALACLVLTVASCGGGGVFIPTISSDQYAATLATWFGVGDSDLPAVSPNVVNFSSRNLGFMA